MHCFKREPRNHRKIWILQYCPGLLSRIVATASAILPHATSTFPIITLFAPQTFCISIVFNFPWDVCNTREKWKTKVMQNLEWGQMMCIMGNVDVAYRAFSSTWPASMQIYWTEWKRWHKKRLVWDTNMAAISLFWDSNMAVKSCENTLFHMWMVVVTFSKLPSSFQDIFFTIRRMLV